MGILSKILDKCLDPLLKNFYVHPDFISYITVLVSAFVLLFPKATTVFLITVLILDALDGYFARKIGRNKQFVDYLCDRASELLIFATRPAIMMLAWINVAISILSLKFKKFWIRPLPLRQLYLLSLLFG